MPVKALGIYAAVILPVNFAFTVLIMPAAIIWHEKYLAAMCRMMCGCEDEIREPAIAYPIDMENIDFGKDFSDDEIVDVNEIEMSALKNETPSFDDLPKIDSPREVRE